MKINRSNPLENQHLIHKEQLGAIKKLQINRPEKKNALTQSMYSTLTAALHEADEDKTTRCVVITGTDDCFTSGNDVKDFINIPQDFSESPVAHFLKALVEFQKPLIAAVNGTAIGIGTTMLLHCDLVFANQSSIFQMPFANLGLCPEAGSTVLLPMLMGHVRSAELLLTGKKFTADEALAANMINSICNSSEAVLEEAINAAKAIAEQPPNAIRVTKRLLKKPYKNTLTQALLEEGEEFLKLIRSPEAMEAFQAFLQKRKPDFSKFS